MLEGVRNGDDPRQLYCSACFTGQYPVRSEAQSPRHDEAVPLSAR
jgi:hypothetical protein